MIKDTSLIWLLQRLNKILKTLITMPVIQVGAQQRVAF